MALVLGRKINEVIFAETNGASIKITLLSHRHNGTDKLALIKVEYDNLDADEHELKVGGELATICSAPEIKIGLHEATRHGVRLSCHADKEVVFLRQEVKERNNG